MAATEKKEATTVAAATENDELMMDSGSEEHVCRKDLCKDGKLGPATSAMRDAAGRPIKNYGTKELEMTLGDKEFGQARCRINWQVGEVEKNVLSAGKVTDAGLYRIILDSEGSFLIHKPSGNQVKFGRKGYAF